jgi:hypothetical protein
MEPPQVVASRGLGQVYDTKLVATRQQNNPAKSPDGQPQVRVVADQAARTDDFLFFVQEEEKT